jgi:hypothetical protein
MIESLRTLTFCAVLLVVLVSAVSRPAVAQSTETPLSQEQLFVMMYTDQGRTIGYQRLLASIELDKIKAELERDHALLEQNRKLYEKNAIPLIELEISQLKDAWNRKQLIVAEKNAEAIGAQFEAVSELIRYFNGEPVTVEALYDSYRRSWDAGCDKGPDEVVAMKAWAAYAEKSLERARQLNSRGTLSLAVLLEREAQMKIARSNAESRAGRLDRCRAVLFPSLEDIQRISR